MAPGKVLAGAGPRERSVLAVAELCAERGYGELEAAAICERAGIDLNTFEAQFGDAEGAVEAAIDAILAAVVDLVGELYSPDRSEAESYAVAIAGILELMAANPAFAYVSYITSRQIAPPHLGTGLESGARVLAAMMERLGEGQEAPPARAARAALGGAEAVVRREVAQGRCRRLPELAGDFVYAACVPFLGQAEALRLARTR